MTPTAPTRLGRFEVGAKIGGGGMATVYVGREVHDDGDETLVALKVIRDELSHDEQFLAMFIDEAKILSRLSHPNVIQTLEYGVSGHHRFIAMELLMGRTAADVWDTLGKSNGRFDLGVAAWICARVAEGMHSAHEAVDEAGVPLNVIHRDVNPTNIFLTHAGQVKLIDFGLARARVRLSKSGEGIVKGKIPYLAPEQVHGKPIDRRIDVYALGATLWEMASMKRLFKRDTDVQTLLAIRDAVIPDLRTDHAVPESLWRIIDRALRPDPAERYATADEMRIDLDTFAREARAGSPKVAALLERLYPKSEAAENEWVRGATSVRMALVTMPPPAPIPIASSSLLDLEETPSAPATSPATRPQPSSNPPPPEVNTTRSTARDAAPPAEDTRRLWMIVGVVVVVLLVLAVVATR